MSRIQAMTTSTRKRDVLILGGGPAGATAALHLAREGIQVTVFESTTFPRFHVGESFLPKGLELIQDLGLEEALHRLPQVYKPGAEFLMGHGKDEPSFAWFADALGDGLKESFNLERGPFDAMLLNAARQAGAEVLEGSRVRGIRRLERGHVSLLVGEDEEEWSAQILLDASGQNTVVGRHLQTRRLLPHLKKVAYFGHFRNVQHPSGEAAGVISIVLCEEGWFWLIPLDAERTSIGLVMDETLARKAGVPARQMLRWGIERCPVMAQRCRRAEFPESNGVTADFSYSCRPFAGPGYFLIGDAATFIDPIFSTGVCLAMASAREASRGVEAILRDGARSGPIERRYQRFIDRTTQPFFRLVNQFYSPSFRDLFLSGQGPLGVHRAVIAVLAGEVFPRPTFAMRWRLALMELFHRLQSRFAVAERRETFSLLEAAPVCLEESRDEPASP